uniref:Zinc finger PHD-type domain-containing protein n=1 Tax=Globodera rostochiensis TaxID=31243 RepID=A0A914H353_GLORO
MNVRDKCQLIGEMADYLYELQLVEHALKSPMLNIAKIIFSINPKRRVDKDSIQIKQKPTKKRKNELGGLRGKVVGSQSVRRQQNLLETAPQNFCIRRRGRERLRKGSSNAKSPQKRQASATEHQQQWNEEGEIDQMEYGEEDLERKGKRQLDEAEPTYCLCERVSFGEMICCDYELCSVEWFHFACVNIKSKHVEAGIAA